MLTPHKPSFEAAHLFKDQEEMHHVLEEWYVAWLTTKAYDGASITLMMQHIAVYNFLQAQLRNCNLE